MALNWTQFEALNARGESLWAGESIEEMLHQAKDHCERMMADFEPAAKLVAYWNGLAVDLPQEWTDKFNEIGATYSNAAPYEEEDYKRLMFS